MAFSPVFDALGGGFDCTFVHTGWNLVPEILIETTRRKKKKKEEEEEEETSNESQITRYHTLNTS